MNDPKKAFDPLASLFDGPNLRAIAAATALNAYADDGLDSFLGASYPTEEAEDEGDAPSPVGEIGGWDQVLAALPPPPPSALRAATPRPIAPPVVEMPATVDEPAPIAAAPEAPAEPTIADKLALARSLAQAAMARAKSIAAEPPPKPAPPPAPELDKAALAKALAKAAMARAKVTPPPAPAAPTPAAPVATAPPPKKAGLASRAQRPMSALEAAQAAADSERRRKAAEQIHAVRDLAVQVAGLLRRQLPSASKLEIVNALVLDDRTTSRALWKGHRAKFAAQGALDQVVATTNVLRALDAVAEGQLVASIVETETTEYLVWVDLGSQATIAAFSNARSWYAGVRS
jgi:hypothetical protein